MASAWTLAQVFARRAREQPSRTLLLAGGRPLTYAAVDQRASALAAAFGDLGLGVGDRVAINLPNCAEWVVTMLAVAKLGGVIVPLNPGLSYHELKYQLRHAEASAVVTVEQYRGDDYLQLFEDLIVELPDLHYLVTVGREDLWYDDRIFQFEDLLSKGEGRAVSHPDGVDDASDLAIIYTSGTTGKPKGVRLSHRAVVETALRTGEALEVEPSDRVLALVPLFTAFGLGAAVGTVAAGAVLVLHPEMDAGVALRTIERDEVTVLHAVPTLFHLLMREPTFDPARLRRLRTGVIAGSPAPDELLRRVRRWCDVQVAYGLTETGPTVAITRFGDAEEKRRTTVGRPLPGVEVRTVDPDTRAPLAAGAAGEIAVRGPNLMSGYSRMPDATARAYTGDGFFLTGDLGVLDEDGFLRVVGRTREAIVRGGFQIYPREVEDQLRAHPAVDDVCVIGVPHDVMGELVCACVVPVEGAVVTGEDLKHFADDTMADYKVPDVVRFLDAFPMTGSGEVERRELERMVALDHTATAPSS
jgi:fatty-acyl-CoA synthase